MEKFVKISLIIIVGALLVKQTSAQLSGTYNVGSGQTYTSLTKASGLFNAINTNGLSGNVTANVTSDLSEDGSIQLNQWTEFGGSGYTVTIRPSSATERLISNASANGVINLNGADRLTIDGRFSGSGKYLRIRGSNAGIPTINFQNGASSNTITYCYIEGCNANTAGTTNLGTIFFGSSTGVVGNSSNTISYCDIRDRSDAVGFPAYAIYSYGSATASLYNINNSIQNNNIYNFWKDGDFCGGVYITLGTGSGWNISNNSFYQTATRSSVSGVGAGWNIIFVNFTGINNCTVNNNYIGGTAPNCGGTAWTAASTTTLQFPGIRFYVGVATASSCEGNTISNINLTTTPSAAYPGGLPFGGIIVETGIVNVGDITGNTIGGSTGNSSISVIFAGAYNSAQTVRGIDHRSTGNVINNNIGSIDISGTNPAQNELDAIAYISNPSAIVNISNNNIGSRITANSIRNTSAGLNCYMDGIYEYIISNQVTLTNNTIANLTNTSTQTGAVLYGLLHVGTRAGTITNNSIHDLSCASTNTTNIAVAGLVSSTTAVNQSISGNYIYNLFNTSAGAFNINVTAMDIEGATSTGTTSNNRIYNITNSSTGASPSVTGINAFSGSWTALNNQVTLTNGQPQNGPVGIINKIPGEESVSNLSPGALLISRNISLTPNNGNSLQSGNRINLEEHSPINSNIKSFTNEGDLLTNGLIVRGIYDVSGRTWNYYYNSVYVGGSVSAGAVNSYCYLRGAATTVNFKNNIFFNARTGGTGNHYAIANENGTPATNWSATASNYNLLLSANANTIGEWGTGTSRTIAQWRTSSGGDNSSWSDISGSVSPTNLFTSLSAGDLNIQTGVQESWYINGKGTQLAGYNTDFNGNSRSTTVPNGSTDIGSSEIVPVRVPIVATQSGSLILGGTTTYTFANRTLATITWGNTGSVPTSVSLSYYSGTNPLNGVPTAFYSNAYWYVNATGGSGYTYNISLNYDVAIIGTITTENNIRMAKSSDNGTTWQPYLTAGGGAGQYTLNTINKTITLNGLNSFSTFTLTDDGHPLPVLLASFNAFPSGRDIKLTWKTTQEINNSGFAIEHRYNNGSSGYSDWVQTGFVNGFGNSNSEHLYNFSDLKLASGNYQYRLKQMDYNGNTEYFNLNNPDEIAIGNPVQFDMSQNYPNPSNPNTKIDYQVPSAGRVTLKVYDLTGREVATLMNSELEAGYYTAILNGNNLASGVYFYKLTAVSNGQRFDKTMKMILTK